MRGKNEIDWVLRKCHLPGKATGPLEARSRGQNTITEGDSGLSPRSVSNSEVLPCHKSDRTERNDQRLEWELLGCDPFTFVFCYLGEGGALSLLLYSFYTELWEMIFVRPECP